MLIEDYEFGAFLKSFQEAVLSGYRLNLDSNEYYPQKFGSHMRVLLEKGAETLLVPTLTEAVPTKVVKTKDNAQQKKQKDQADAEAGK